MTANYTFQLIDYLVINATFNTNELPRGGQFVLVKGAGTLEENHRPSVGRLTIKVN